MRRHGPALPRAADPWNPVGAEIARQRSRSVVQLAGATCILWSDGADEEDSSAKLGAMDGAVGGVKHTRTSQRRCYSHKRLFHRSEDVADIHGHLITLPDASTAAKGSSASEGSSATASSTGEGFRLVSRLCKETGFSRRELYAMFLQFKALVAMSATTEGIDRNTFLRGIPILALEDRTFTERVFELLDQDGSEIIEWAEFRDAVTKLEHGAPRIRAQFLFDVYDKDGGGTIDSDEMFEYLLASLRLDRETAPPFAQEMCRSFVEEVMVEIDRDHSGGLDRTKLISYMKQHPSETNVASFFGRAMVPSSSTMTVLNSMSTPLSELPLRKDAHLPLEWVRAREAEAQRVVDMRERVFAKAAAWRRRKQAFLDATHAHLPAPMSIPAAASAPPIPASAEGVPAAL